MTKYRVITDYGFREFKEEEYAEAVDYHAVYGIAPIETVEYELPDPNQVI